MGNNQSRSDKALTSDPVEIEAALRLLDRELWIITAADGLRRGGLIATWVMPASIDRQRPALLAAIGPNHYTAELVQASRSFAAHLLKADQIELAWNFARDSGRFRDKLARLTTEQGQTGAPLVVDCLAWFECRVFARHEAGARLFLWADVVAASSQPPGAVQTLREQHFFNTLTAEQRQTLVAARDADAALYRPIDDIWRLSNPW